MIFYKNFRTGRLDRGVPESLPRVCLQGPEEGDVYPGRRRRVGG